MDKDEFEHKVWMVQEQFYAIRYIIDARYLLGGSTIRAERLNIPEENTVQFLQGSAPSSPKHFLVFQFLMFKRYVILL